MLTQIHCVIIIKFNYSHYLPLSKLFCSILFTCAIISLLLITKSLLTMKLIEFFVAKDGRLFEDQDQCVAYEQSLGTGDTPYLYKPINSLSQERQWNPKYDNDAVCECGHAYYRHFDSYENNDPVGCKYCNCHSFTLHDKNTHNHTSNCQHH